MVPLHAVSLIMHICGRAPKADLPGAWLAYTHIYDGLPKCLFLVLLINRNSLRAASYLVFKTMIYLNTLKPCILSFTFETVAKTCSKC